MTPSTQAFRGEILHFVADPAQTPNTRDSYEHYADGLLLLEHGKVRALGHARDLLGSLAPDTEIIHYKDALITPGFVDTHVHYPQAEMIGAFGEQLLEWLETYTFPTEKQYADRDYAAQRSEFFLDQLLANGTTTAMVFGTVHPESVDAFFEQAEARQLRMICGKVLMDRNAPEYLTDTAASGYADSKALIEKWHGRGRLQYAVTPRFAPTSSHAQLAKAGELLKEFPGVYMQTHLAENHLELDWVKALHPEQENYLQVYDQHGLLGRRSVFAHGIHLCDDECQRLAETQSAVAFCPTSNLFLGSGLFNLSRAETYGYHVGFGTDVGAGTSLSMLQTMNEAYKVQQLRGDTLSQLKSFYLATLGGARALDLQDKIGNFEVGKEADFIVLDYQATALVKMRMQQCSDLLERLFVLSVIGDDRAVRATHIMGKRQK